MPVTSSQTFFGPPALISTLHPPSSPSHWWLSCLSESHDTQGQEPRECKFIEADAEHTFSARTQAKARPETRCHPRSGWISLPHRPAHRPIHLDNSSLKLSYQETLVWVKLIIKAITGHMFGKAPTLPGSFIRAGLWNQFEKINAGKCKFDLIRGRGLRVMSCLNICAVKKQKKWVEMNILANRSELAGLSTIMPRYTGAICNKANV